MEAEKAAHDTAIMQLSQKIEDLEAENSDLTKERDRTSKLYQARKKELEMLNSTHGAMEHGAHAELNSLKKENDTLKRTIAVSLYLRND